MSEVESLALLIADLYAQIRTLQAENADLRTRTESTSEHQAGPADPPA